MATYNGNNVTNTSGSSTRTWYTRLVYTITDYPTYVDVSLTVQMYLSGGTSTTISISASRINPAKITIAGTVVKSYTGPSSTTTVKGSTPWTLVSYSTTYNKTHSQQTKACSGAITVTSASAWKGTSTATLTGGIIVPALASYTVSYNTNSGTGTIADDTKWYDEDLTLSDGTGFSYANHTLIGWNTAADGSGTHYDLGDTYSANEGLTLYAEWELNAVQVKTKVSGTWYPSFAYVKVNGAWYQAIKGYVKVNGTWYQIE